MFADRCLGALLLVGVCGPCRAGMLSWLFPGDGPEAVTSTTAAGGPDGARLVPFEVQGADDKFLAEVKRLTSLELSELDMCQHKIFLSLHQSCSKLSEEDMAKISVQLLNCQSESEGRPVFTCTSDMTIAACTRHMDPHAWNAYHIVSNRARAVCYAARQQQFRASTELAVNRLAAQTFRQLEQMQQLEGSQQALERLTSDTMEQVARGQQDLLSRHGQLRNAQASIQSHVVDNLRELGRVRSAISVGQAGVSHTLEQIRAGLRQAEAELRRQEDARNSSHRQLAADLERIHASAALLLARLESVDGATRAVVGRFDQLMSSLERMNGTIFTLLSTLEATQRQVDQKLGWLLDVLGSDLHLVSAVLLHLGFLLLGMLLLAFLQAPYSARLGLLLLVPVNLLSLLQGGAVLEFSAITTLLVTLGVGHHLAVWVWGRWRRPAGARQDSAPLLLLASSLSERSAAPPPAELSRLSTREVDSSDSDGEREMEPAGVRRTGVSAVLGGAREPLRREMSRSSPLRQRLQPARPEREFNPLSPLLNSSTGAGSPLSSTLNTNSGLARAGLSPSSGERPWCAATCRSGLRCRNAAGFLSPFCGLHGRGSRESTPAARDSG